MMLEDLGSVLSNLGTSLDASFDESTFRAAAETFVALALGHKHSSLRSVNLRFASPAKLAEMVLAQEASGLRPACRTVPYFPRVGAREPATRQIIGLYVPERDCYATDRLVPGLSSSLPQVQSVTSMHELGHLLIDAERRRQGTGNLGSEEWIEADRLCEDFADLFGRYVFGPVEHQPPPAAVRAGMQGRFRELTGQTTKNSNPTSYGRPSKWYAVHAAVQAALRNPAESSAATL